MDSLFERRKIKATYQKFRKTKKSTTKLNRSRENSRLTEKQKDVVKLKTILKLNLSVNFLSKRKFFLKFCAFCKFSFEFLMDTKGFCCFVSIFLNAINFLWFSFIMLNFFVIIFPWCSCFAKKQTQIQHI